MWGVLYLLAISSADSSHLDHPKPDHAHGSVAHEVFEDGNAHSHHGHDHHVHDHHDHHGHDHQGHGHDHHGHGHDHHGHGHDHHGHDHDHGGLGGVLHSVMDMCPWLLIGMLITAIMQAVMPPRFLEACLGGSGVGGILRAAIIGLCAPLCSCGALPFALFLGDSGRSSPAVVVAFLTGAQACGIDSFLLTYGLIGSREAAARVVFSWILAVAAGISVMSLRWNATNATSACCKSDEDKRLTLMQSIKRVFTTDFDEVFPWVALGILFTTLMTGLGVGWITSSFLSRILIAFGAIPLQLCEHSAVTFTAGMAKAGATKGMAFAFLVCTPATNFATLGLFRRRISDIGCARLAGIIGLFHLALGIGIDASGVYIAGDERPPSELPEWLQFLATGVVLLLSAGSLFRLMFAKKHIHAH